MALPVMTPGQRADALAKAKAAQAERAGLKRQLKNGELTLAEVIRNESGSEVIAKTRVAALVGALPGMGPAKTKGLMGRLGIPENRRVGGLGPNQRAALETALAPVPA